MKKMYLNPKTALKSDSSLLSHSDQLPRAMRRLLAVVGFSVSVGSAGTMLLHSTTAPTPVAEINPSPDTLHSLLSQNTDRKYDLARVAIASGEVDQPPTASTAVPTVIVHEVKQDETLWHLTQMYRVDAATIAASNNISSATELQVGMKLVIPPVDGLIHRVRQGETLDSIANFYKVSKQEILKYSTVASADFLAIDQPLVIPGNVSQLLQVKETNAKRQLVAEKERLRRQLAQIEGETVPVSNTLHPPAINKPPKPNSLVFSYTVRPGDTVSTIARRHGVREAEIVALNKLNNPHWIQVDQELKVPVANPQPTTIVASANLTTPVKVRMGDPMHNQPVSAWDGLMVLAGAQPAPVSAGQDLVALNIAIPNQLPLEQMPQQLPPRVTPTPSMLIAPEPSVVAPPKLPEPTPLAEQEPRPTAPTVAIAPQPAQEPQVVAVAVPVPQLPLSQLAEQMENNLSRPTAAAVLMPESEARMTSPEVRKLEQEVDQLAVKVREAQERRRQEEMRLAAARLQPSNPTTIIPVPAPSSTPQLPSLTAKAYLPDVQEYGLMTGFIWPAQGIITSGFGPRWGRLHQGIDIAGPVGTPIVAAASGRVTFSGWNDGGYGYLVEILHPDGTVTRYAHNSALYVRTGEQVSQGQLIAAMGSTGYSTGPHLHFEIRPNGGAAIDPMIYLARVRR